MPEIIFNGPEGRLEGRYQPGNSEESPLALILHPHPQMPNGNMNNRITYTLFQTFSALGFAVLRFNFRGVGRSQGVYDEGQGELGDAAAALDWLQMMNRNAKTCWIAGYSFGAWIGMQLLMRRPEISGFISVAPPANSKDFSFLAPCPASGVPDRSVPGAPGPARVPQGWRAGRSRRPASPQAPGPAGRWRRCPASWCQSRAVRCAESTAQIFSML